MTPARARERWLAGDFNGDGRTRSRSGAARVVSRLCLLFNIGGMASLRGLSLHPARRRLQWLHPDLNHNGKPDLVIGNFGLDPPNVNVVFHQ